MPAPKGARNVQAFRDIHAAGGDRAKFLEAFVRGTGGQTYRQDPPGTAVPTYTQHFEQHKDSILRQAEAVRQSHDEWNSFLRNFEKAAKRGFGDAGKAAQVTLKEAGSTVGNTVGSAVGPVAGKLALPLALIAGVAVAAYVITDKKVK